MARKRVPFMECGGCGEDVPLLPDNAMVVRFRIDPQYDYVLMQCECGTWTRNFIEASTCEKLIGFSLEVVYEVRAPGEVIEAYHETRGIPFDPPPTRELTAHEERIVEFFHWLLERGDIT